MSDYGETSINEFMKGDVDTEYLMWIKALPCIICGHRAEPHHLEKIQMGGKRGKTQNGSDYSAIPLCREHHTEVEQGGNTKFEKKYFQNVWRNAWSLYLLWTKERASDGQNPFGS